MYSFKQYLEEGRDAPLYHGTNFESLSKILSSNTLEARTDQGDKFSWSDKKDHNVKRTHFTGNKPFKGTSLSRWMNRSLQWRGGNLAIELDQRKLAQRHKIVPLNIFAAVGSNKHGKDEELFEEFVIGDVKNIKSYITRIIFKNKPILRRYLGGYADKKNLIGLTIYVSKEKETFHIQNINDFDKLYDELSDDYY